uniref:Uncharacterized protein n=1 Tax=Medicago truncatula TaxID=3880 RepID=I3SPC5_MEDTR|nr:unknown [Medicago truncatula]
MANVRSQDAATSSGDGLYLAPKLIRGSHLLLVLFQTVRSTPALMRFRAIGVPMIPRPKKPIRGGVSVPCPWGCREAETLDTWRDKRGELKW